MKLFFYMLAVCGAAMVSGCASICSKSQYPVTFSTNAPDAVLSIRSVDSGMILRNGSSPLTVTLPASRSFFCPAAYQCEVKSNGKMQYQTIVAKMDPWFFGNFIIGGILGMAIDGVSGAAFKLENGCYVHFSEN